ncbi:MAG TPA: aminoglycoside phosphotransferase family protein [Ktedonobacterales bacterium]|nr:aminoglycoside phosphotransferase family protein [Ktedonobacterales bacterium]
MDAPFLLADLVEHLNIAHHSTFIAGDRYALGEQGAYALSDAQGHRYVLKWQPRANHLERVLYAQAVTERLRAQGYPSPAYLHIGAALGGTYSVQQALPGTPIGCLTLQNLPDILKLQALHAMQAPPGPRTWPREVVQTVLEGGDGYCLHISLQQHSPETARMLQTLQRLVADYQQHISETNEIVHFDFQAANFLVYQDRLSGVVDWEAASAGDSAFDLATLLFYGYDDAALRDFLWQYSLARRPIQVISIYLAHLILRQVDWSLRHHEEAVSERYIARGQTLLADIHAHLPQP